jgi:hypothetical protein
MERGPSSVAQLVNNSSTVTDPEGSLPCSIEPDNGPYPEPDKSTPLPYTLFLEAPF